jgi:hypothetical protein
VNVQFDPLQRSGEFSQQLLLQAPLGLIAL